MKFHEGDVVLAHITFADGTGTKPRPVIILRCIPESFKYIVAECYSDKEHYGRDFGILIKQGSAIFQEMGLRCNSFITRNISAIFEKNIIEKWGVYKQIDVLKDKLR